jgi:hypothetical protein
MITSKRVKLVRQERGLVHEWERGEPPAGFVAATDRAPKAALTEQEIDDLLQIAEAVFSAKFRVGLNVPHPFLPTVKGAPTLWCNECERDSGFHWKTCSKAKR